MHDDTTAPTRPASIATLGLTCARCGSTFASVAGLYGHRMAPADGLDARGGRTGTPCQPRYGEGTPNSPLPRVLDTGPIHSLSWLCPPVAPSGIGESAGPVLVVCMVTRDEVAA